MPVNMEKPWVTCRCRHMKVPAGGSYKLGWDIHVANGPHCYTMGEKENSPINPQPHNNQ